MNLAQRTCKPSPEKAHGRPEAGACLPLGNNKTTPPQPRKERMADLRRVPVCLRATQNPWGRKCGRKLKQVEIIMLTAFLGNSFGRPAQKHQHAKRATSSLIFAGIMQNCAVGKLQNLSASCFVNYLSLFCKEAFAQAACFLSEVGLCPSSSGKQDFWAAGLSEVAF